MLIDKIRYHANAMELAYSPPDSLLEYQMAQALIVAYDIAEPLKGAIVTTHPDNFKSGWNEAMKEIRKAMDKEES